MLEDQGGDVADIRVMLKVGGAVGLVASGGMAV